MIIIQTTFNKCANIDGFIRNLVTTCFKLAGEKHIIAKVV